MLYLLKRLGSQHHSEEDFVAHLKANHSTAVAPEDRLLLARISRFSSPTELSKCPVCGWSPKGVKSDQQDLLDHVAKEIHKFSLRSLPWADLQETEAESDERLKYSQSMVSEWLMRTGVSEVDLQKLKRHMRPMAKSSPDRRPPYFDVHPYFAECLSSSSSSGDISTSSRAGQLSDWDQDFDSLDRHSNTGESDDYPTEYHVQQSKRTEVPVKAIARKPGEVSSNQVNRGENDTITSQPYEDFLRKMSCEFYYHLKRRDEQGMAFVVNGTPEKVLRETTLHKFFTILREAFGSVEDGGVRGSKEESVAFVNMWKRKKEVYRFLAILFFSCCSIAAAKALVDKIMATDTWPVGDGGIKLPTENIDDLNELFQDYQDRNELYRNQARF